MLRQVRDAVVGLANGRRQGEWLMPGGSWSPHEMPGRAMLRGGGGVVQVGYDTAQSHRAVYSAIDLLCRLIVWQMPFEAYRKSVRVDLPEIVVNPDPQPQLLAEHWRAGAFEATILRGYACGVVTDASPLGHPTRIHLCHPDALAWDRDRHTGAVTWKLGGEKVDLWQTGGDLWVAPAPRVPPGGVVGLGVLRYARDAIALGLTASRYASDYFGAGGTPIVHAKVTSRKDLDDDQIEVLRSRIVSATQGRQPLVTGSNLELDKLAVTAEDSQFLATIAANVADVAGFFGVPAESIGGQSGGSLTYATVEGRNLELLTNTVGAWMRWWAATLSALTPGVTLKLDPEALLQTSVRALYETIATGVGRGTPGVLTPNEGRAWLGYGRVDDPAADQLYLPSSVVPIPNPTDPITAGVAP